MHLPPLVCDLLRGQGHLCVHSTHHQALAQSRLLVNMYLLNRSLHLELSPHAPYVHVQTIWLDPLSQRLKETLSAELWFNLMSHPRLLSRAHFWGQGCQEGWWLCCWTHGPEIRVHQRPEECGAENGPHSPMNFYLSECTSFLRSGVTLVFKLYLFICVYVCMLVCANF